MPLVLCLWFTSAPNRSPFLLVHSLALQALKLNNFTMKAKITPAAAKTATTTLAETVSAS